MKRLIRSTDVSSLVLALMLVAFVASATAGRASGVDNAEPVHLTADEIRFRETFGLSTTVQSGDSVTESSVVRYGVRLSRREEADIALRLERQNELGPLVDFVSRHAADFGGIWLDQKITRGDGFLVNVATLDTTPTGLLTGPSL